jgi:hypothetical protein
MSEVGTCMQFCVLYKTPVLRPLGMWRKGQMKEEGKERDLSTMLDNSVTWWLKQPIAR